MKSIKALLFVSAVVTALCACSNVKPSVKWIEGEGRPAVHTFIISNASKISPDAEIWFAQCPARFKDVEGSDGSVKEIMSTAHRITLNYEEGKDEYVIKYQSSPLRRHSWAPEAFVLKEGEKETRLEAEYEFLPLASDGAKWYERNAGVKYIPTNEYDMIPALKVLKMSEQRTGLYRTLDLSSDGAFDSETEFLTGEYASFSELLPEGTLKVNFAKAGAGHPAGWYSIAVNDGISVEAADADGAFYAVQTILNALANTQDASIANAVIEDWPDLEYRGMMLDVSRNFTTKDNVLRMIDVFAHYKLNVFHLHLAEDEAWRFAVDGIDELTSFGSTHAIPEFAADGKLIETKGLVPSYDGCTDINDVNATSNGFYTRDDLIEIIRYADARHMRVIPEIDIPGHSRAAIKAMILYEKRTGDSSMRLHDPEDVSEYSSAQYYNDNVFCVASESVYNFIDRITAYLKSVYETAGVPFEIMHYGGDEVPSGAWEGSPVCQAFMAENGMKSTRELKSYFVSRLALIAKKYNVRIAGWQEMTMGLTPKALKAVKDVLYGVNCWSVVSNPGMLEQFAKDGIRMIYCAADYAYADQAYSDNKEELGHDWSSFISEEVSFGTLPKLPGARIIGTESPLFTETIRSFDDVCYDVFPKVLGVFERGWNVNPGDNTFDKYYSVIIDNEMPFFDRKGINYHIPQPGLIRENGAVKANSMIPGAAIEIAADSTSAVLLYNGKKSCTTTL